MVELFVSHSFGNVLARIASVAAAALSKRQGCNFRGLIGVDRGNSVQLTKNAALCVQNAVRGTMRQFSQAVVQIAQSDCDDDVKATVLGNGDCLAASAFCASVASTDSVHHR